jgi:hypothetical protein
MKRLKAIFGLSKQEKYYILICLFIIIILITLQILNDNGTINV